MAQARPLTNKGGRDDTTGHVIMTAMATHLT